MRLGRCQPSDAILAALALLLAAALPAPGVLAQRYVPTDDPAHPKLKFPDSLVSANDRCMVRHEKLNPKVRPIYVNGVPLGFC